MKEHKQYETVSAASEVPRDICNKCSQEIPAGESFIIQECGQPQHRKCPPSKPAAADAPEAPRIAKVYWKDLPADAKVLEQANQYFVDGKLVYWHGHEDKQAQFWLGTHLSADAQPSAPPSVNFTGCGTAEEEVGQTRQSTIDEAGHTPGPRERLAEVVAERDRLREQVKELLAACKFAVNHPNRLDGLAHIRTTIDRVKSSRSEALREGRAS